MKKRNQVIELIKKKMPLNVKLKIINLMMTKKFKSKEKLFFKPSPKPRIFLMLATDYPNLGDHALTISHKEFLLKNFGDYEVVEFFVNETIEAVNSMKEMIKTEDIITLKGGGNIGIEYFREELMRRYIINNFPENKIVLFPQTVFFPKTKLGIKEEHETMKVFKKHKNLRIFVRDEKSYNILKTHSVRNVNLVPDIVFSYSTNYQNEYDRNNKNILLCLRNDREKSDERITQKEMEEFLLNMSYEVSETDTVVKYDVDKKNRYNELNGKLKQFSDSRLVVTDRLHGMIFCYITGTPCIVLKTYNHKVTGQYEWIKDSNFIKFASNITEFSTEFKNILKIKVEKSSDKYLEDSFIQIISELSD
jgi:pyruvyl transferase EpsI